jgi:hypothetical protein
MALFLLGLLWGLVGLAVLRVRRLRAGSQQAALLPKLTYEAGRSKRCDEKTRPERGFSVYRGAEI